LQNQDDSLQSAITGENPQQTAEVAGGKSAEKELRKSLYLQS
jgi:hypothetical protein